jgi:hypothetical protein
VTNTIRIDGIKQNVQNPHVVARAWRIYEDRQAGRPTPVLECTAEHRGEMYLQPRKHSILGVRLWAMHKPGQGHTCTGIGFSNEGPGHIAAKEYAVRAWERHGYTAATEYSTGPTRLDVAVIDAPAKIGFEAQFSPIKAEAARGRTTKSHKAGWTPIWLPGRHDMALAGCHSIPMARPHTDIAWTAGTPKPGTVHVLSKRLFVMEPCTARGQFTSCPVTGSGMCGGFHPFFPAPDGGFDVLDEVLGELAAGLTVPLMDAKGVVRLVTAEDFRRYEEATGLSGEYRPASDKPKTVLPTLRNIPCTAERPVEVGDVSASLHECEPDSVLENLPEQNPETAAQTVSANLREPFDQPVVGVQMGQEPEGTINAEVFIWLLEDGEAVVKFPDFHPDLYELGAILTNTVGWREYIRSSYHWVFKSAHVHNLTLALRARGVTVTASSSWARGSEENQRPWAYKAGLCADCRVVAHSAGRPRCNDCHQAWQQVAS